MSTPETGTTGGSVAESHDDEHDHVDHASDWDYIKVGILLAILTAIEVALYYFPPGGFEVPALLGLMVVKFVIVAAYFMHLKTDNRLLTQIFMIGLVLASLVYVAALSAFEFWS